MDRLNGDKARAVELGAGSGQATAQIAVEFDHVTVVEPDTRLAEEGAFAENVSVIVGAAEQVDFQDASIDAVISATAFHWMDQPLVCKNVARWLRAGGAFFPFAMDLYRFEGAAQGFFEAEFEKWRPFRDRRLVDNYDYVSVLERSNCFSTVVRFEDEVTREISAGEAAGFICTASFVNAYALATIGPAAYLQFVEEKLAAIGDPLRITLPMVGALGRVS